MAPALLLALSLMATSAPSAAAPGAGGEPLPPGVPTDDYELTGWCYGALGEYLDIYDRVKPDLVAIDKMWGTSVRESEPYASDIAAARQELKVLGSAMEAAEKASPKPIAPQGAAAIKLGQAIWSPAEMRPRRELARAWLTWGLPDQCGTTARTLASRSALLGRALSYNNGGGGSAAPAAAPNPQAPMIQPIAPVTPAAQAVAPQAPPPEAPSPGPAAPEPAAPQATAAPEPAAAEPSGAAPTDVAVAQPPKPTVIEEPAQAAAEPPAPRPAPTLPQPVAPTALTAAPAPAPPAASSPASDESSEPVL